VLFCRIVEAVDKPLSHILGVESRVKDFLRPTRFGVHYAGQLAPVCSDSIGMRNAKSFPTSFTAASISLALTMA
jgi:hypothetical protein